MGTAIAYDFKMDLEDRIVNKENNEKHIGRRYFIRQDLKAFDKLLSQSVIILNSYSKYYVPENQQLIRMCMEGTSLVLEILALLQKIETILRVNISTCRNKKMIIYGYYSELEYIHVETMFLYIETLHQVSFTEQ